jgi:DNA-directed RNA polymerase specialized sigma24 family protein
MDAMEVVPGAPPAPSLPGIADDAGFEAAFREHFAAVYRFIARRVGPDLADDLAADTFATAFRQRGAYRPDRASLRSWLYGRLSREQREVLLLHAWADLDHHEIAAALRIPPGTPSLPPGSRSPARTGYIPLGRSLRIH